MQQPLLDELGPHFAVGSAAEFVHSPDHELPDFGCQKYGFTLTDISIRVLFVDYPDAKPLRHYAWLKGEKGKNRLLGRYRQ